LYALKIICWPSDKVSFDGQGLHKLFGRYVTPMSYGNIIKCKKLVVMKLTEVVH
jgi:hypothetical protein